MPGPQSKYRHNKGRLGVVGNPNKRAAARLGARLAAVPNSGFYPTGMKTSYFHKPGSQNRKK